MEKLKKPPIRMLNIIKTIFAPNPNATVINTVSPMFFPIANGNKRKVNTGMHGVIVDMKPKETEARSGLLAVLNLVIFVLQFFSFMLISFLTNIKIPKIIVNKPNIKIIHIDILGRILLKKSKNVAPNIAAIMPKKVYPA